MLIFTIDFLLSLAFVFMLLCHDLEVWFLRRVSHACLFVCLYSGFEEKGLIWILHWNLERDQMVNVCVCVELSSTSLIIEVWSCLFIYVWSEFEEDGHSGVAFDSCYCVKIKGSKFIEVFDPWIVVMIIHVYVEWL